MRAKGSFRTKTWGRSGAGQDAPAGARANFPLSLTREVVLLMGGEKVPGSFQSSQIPPCARPHHVPRGPSATWRGLLRALLLAFAFHAGLLQSVGLPRT